MRRRELVFVLPEDRELPTGGNLYNRMLLEALREAGLSLRVVGPDHGTLIQTADYYVDSLLLAQVPRLRKLLNQGQKLFALLHYLPSLSLSSAERRNAEQEENKLLEGLNGIIVTSSLLQKNLEQRRVSPPIRVIPPALFVQPDANARQKTPGDFPAGDLRGFMAANLIPGKGITDFLRALARLGENDDHFHVRIAGRVDLDPDYARECRSIIDGEPVLRERIEILGALSREDMAREYQNNHVLVSASTLETFGMALAEARAFGLYILALRGGYVENHLAREDTGRLFDHSEELAHELLRLARHPRELNQVRERARASRAPVDYHWADAARAFASAESMAR